jgi:hypothetical protein
MARAALLLPLAIGVTWACEPKEAQDPSEILAEDLAFQNPFLPHEPADGPASRALATRAECLAAARHLEELAVAAAIAEAETDAERTAIEAERRAFLEGEDAEARREQAAGDCLVRETSREEAKCVARMRHPAELDECVH